MTDQVKFYEEETSKHINNVNHYLMFISAILKYRGMNHDRSKFSAIERDTFIEYTPKLKNSTYNSDEYKGFLKEMNVALDHHYKTNRHHPEHYENGINDMNLIDLIEMIFDWLAATKRHSNGDINKSIEMNKTRFNYGDQLESIFTNTVKIMDSYMFDVVESVFTPEDNDNIRIMVYDWYMGNVSLSDENYISKYDKEDVSKARDIAMTLISMGLG